MDGSFGLSGIRHRLLSTLDGQECQKRYPGPRFAGGTLLVDTLRSLL
jgi:hypothetical protein